MAELSHVLTTSVAALGFVTLMVARLSAFRHDFRKGVSLALTAVTLLTIVLSLNVIMASVNLRPAVAAESVPSVNGLLLAGLILLLVSVLGFFFSIGVLVWSFVPGPGDIGPLPVDDPTAQPPTPVGPYTP